MSTSPMQDNPSESGALGLKSGRRVLSQPTELTLRKGDVLFREGDESRELFLVKDGRLQVTQGQGESRVELAEVAKQGLVGEMSLLDGMPRSATVRAATDSVVTVIGPALLKEWLDAVPPWLMQVVQVVVRRLREANRSMAGREHPSGLEAFCRFLALKCQEDGSRTRTFPLQRICPEFALVSGLHTAEVTVLSLRLQELGLVRISFQREMTVVDAWRLDEYLQQRAVSDVLEERR